jgi:8-oxo-dGTP pyrophosphatase MutT (NUDIX family)
MPGRSGAFRPERPTVAELASGAVVVLETNDSVLLLHESEEDRWCLPKGHVEPRETLRGAAEREVREETGLATFRLLEEVAEVHYRFYQPSSDRNVHKTVVYFLGLTPGEKVRPEPIFDRFQWVTPQASLKLLKFPSDRTAVVRAMRHLTRLGRLKGGSSKSERGTKGLA